MRPLHLILALAILAGCTTPDEPEGTPTPGDTNPEGIRPAVDVDVSLVDRTPGVGLPPTTMGIVPERLELALSVPVNLTVLNDGAGVHNLLIAFEGDDEIMSDDLDAGASQSILFTPTAEGEFEMYCTIGGDGPTGHRAQGMRGIVAIA
jgi:hypothetical protein